jgi:hypothetical protein
MDTSYIDKMIIDILDRRDERIGAYISQEEAEEELQKELNLRKERKSCDPCKDKGAANETQPGDPEKESPGSKPI